jgi:hypothetical protein
MSLLLGAAPLGRRLRLAGLLGLRGAIHSQARVSGVYGRVRALSALGAPLTGRADATGIAHPLGTLCPSSSLPLGYAHRHHRAFSPREPLDILG